MGDEADAGQLAIDDTFAPVPPWWRRHLIGLVAVGGFVVLAAWGIGFWATRPHAPDYSGRTISVTFDYECINAVGWQDPKTHYLWWAGHDPVLSPNFETSPPTAAVSMPTHHSKGQLHFDSEKQATFTSDAGGQLVLIRQPLKQFYSADCRIR